MPRYSAIGCCNCDARIEMEHGAAKQAIRAKLEELTRWVRLCAGQIGDLADGQCLTPFVESEYLCSACADKILAPALLARLRSRLRPRPQFGSVVPGEGEEAFA